MSVNFESTVRKMFSKIFTDANLFMGLISYFYWIIFI